MTHIHQLGRAIARLRVQRKLTQAKLSKLSGVCPSVISRLERGFPDTSHTCSVDQVLYVVSALGMRLVMMPTSGDKDEGSKTN